MEQGIKPGFFCRIGKNAFTKLAAIQCAIGIDDCLTEMVGDGLSAGVLGSTTWRAMISASIIVMPKRENASATVLLPLPMPPVNATIYPIKSNPGNYSLLKSVD